MEFQNYQSPSSILTIITVIGISDWINKPINSFWIKYYTTILHRTHLLNRYLLLVPRYFPNFRRNNFRGIILKGLLTRYNSKYAILFSSIIFSNTLENHYKYGNSCVRSKVRLLQNNKSIGTTILFHSFANLIVVTENYFIYKYVNLEYLNSINIFYSFYQHWYLYY
jgi:hypothetical protein